MWVLFSVFNFSKPYKCATNLYIVFAYNMNKKIYKKKESNTLSLSLVVAIFS